MESLGQYLKNYRESKGIRLEEIASITKIHLRNLELLEGDAWDQLPPDPFLRGFLIAYGKYVGLDAKDLVARYKAEMAKRNPTPVVQSGAGGATPTPNPPTPEPVTNGPTPGDIIDKAPLFSARKVAGGIGIVAIVGVLASLIYLGKKATDQAMESSAVDRQAAAQTTKGSPAPSASDAAQVPVPSPATPVVPSPERAAPTEAPMEPVVKKSDTSADAAGRKANHRVLVEGAERTWIKVVVDDSPPLEYFLPQGEKVSYQAKEKIKVVLGNATGAKVFYNGKITEGVSFLGTIRTYKFPPDAEFPQDTPGNKRAPSSTRIVEEIPLTPLTPQSPVSPFFQGSGRRD